MKHEANMNRPATYAKHNGRRPAAAEVQLDIFTNGPPKEMTAKPRKRPTLAAGRAAGEKGIASALAHAERDVAGWMELAISAVRLAVATSKPGSKFTMEQIRARVEDGIPPPDELRAWGAVTRICKKRGILAATGRLMPAATSHGSLKPAYKAGPNALGKGPAN